MSVRFNRMTEDWRVSDVRTREDGSEYHVVEVGEKEFCQCGCPNCRSFEMVYRDHTAGVEFEDASEAADWIEEMADRFEEQMEAYEEQNAHAIRQSELYELWRSEY